MEKETNIGFALYGTPAESLCYRLQGLIKKDLVLLKMLQIKDIIQIHIMLM